MPKTPPKFSSSPDLSAAALPGNITTRKRKHEDDFKETFNEFSNNIMSTLKEWKTDLECNFSELNNNVNNIIKKDLTKLNESTIEMKNQIKTIIEDFKKVKVSVIKMEERQKSLDAEVTSLKSSMQFVSDQHEITKEEIKCLTSYTKKIDVLEAQLKEVKSENELLRVDMNTAEQRDRLANLEIIGIPEVKDENLSDIISKLAKHVDVVLTQDDIIHVHRVTPRAKVQGRPRVIVVKFKTRLIRDNILSRSKKCSLKTNMLQLGGENVSIYVNEHLTFHNKQLLKKCKDIAKLKMYQYVWVRNGKIFLRKNDVSLPVLIQKEEDFKKIS